MRSTRFVTTTIGLLAGTAALGVGCQKPKPPPPAPPPVVWTPPKDRSSQARELVGLVNDVDRDANQLPGSSFDEHRQIVARLLKNLSEALRLAQGPSASRPEFANRLGVVDASQAVIADSGIERPRLEAAENDAVRAAIDALDQIATQQMPDDKQLAQQFDGARAKLDTMYKTPGPMHDLEAADGFKLVTQILRRVSDDLSERYGSSSGAAPQPPAVEASPTSEPSSAPQ